MANTAVTRAFRDGFLKGFTSPYSLFLTERSPYTHPSRDITVLSWMDVGRSLNQAYNTEITARVEAAAETNRKRTASGVCI